MYLICSFWAALRLFLHKCRVKWLVRNVEQFCLKGLNRFVKLHSRYPVTTNGIVLSFMIEEVSSLISVRVPLCSPFDNTCLHLCVGALPLANFVKMTYLFSKRKSEV